MPHGMRTRTRMSIRLAEHAAASCRALYLVHTWHKHTHIERHNQTPVFFSSRSSCAHLFFVCCCFPGLPCVSNVFIFNLLRGEVLGGLPFDGSRFSGSFMLPLLSRIRTRGWASAGLEPVGLRALPRGRVCRVFVVVSGMFLSRQGENERQG